MTGSERVFFTVCSVMLLLSGIAQILLDAIIAYYKYISGDYRILLLALAVCFLALSGFISVIVAAVSLANRKRRIRTGKLAVSGRIIIILALVGCVFLGLKSIYAWQIITAAILGILIPVIYVMSAIRKNF